MEGASARAIDADCGARRVGWRHRSVAGILRGNAGHRAARGVGDARSDQVDIAGIERAAGSIGSPMTGTPSMGILAVPRLEDNFAYLVIDDASAWWPW